MTVQPRFSLLALLILVAALSGVCYWYSQHRGWVVSSSVVVTNTPSSALVVPDTPFQALTPVTYENADIEAIFERSADPEILLPYALLKLTETDNSLIRETDNPLEWLSDHTLVSYDNKHQAVHVTLSCRNDWGGDVKEIAVVVTGSLYELLIRTERSKRIWEADFVKKRGKFLRKVERDALQAPEGAEQYVRAHLGDIAELEREFTRREQDEGSALKYLQNIAEENEQWSQRLRSDPTYQLKFEKREPAKVKRFW